MYRKNSSGWVKHVDFILLDLLCIQLAFYFSYVCRMGEWNPAMHFFWDKKDQRAEVKIDDCLSFHQLDDTLFLRYMSGAKAYADRKSTRLNSSHRSLSRMPSSA